MTRFSGNSAQEIINNNTILDQAYLETTRNNPPSYIQSVSIPLDTARTLENPFVLGFAWKSVYVSSATDSNTNIDITLFTNATINQKFPLKRNGVLSFEHPIGKSYFTWDAQAGKDITLHFILNGNFRPGSLISEVSSTVDGNSINEYSPVTIASTTATLVDSNLRNLINIQNEGPGDCYIGGSGVSAVAGSELGLLLRAGDERQYRNTASIYAASATSAVLRFQNEV